MPSKHLILCHLLLLLPSICPSFRVFLNESALHIRWPTYWSFSITPSSEYWWLILFRIDSLYTDSNQNKRLTLVLLTKPNCNNKKKGKECLIPSLRAKMWGGLGVWSTGNPDHLLSCSQHLNARQRSCWECKRRYTVCFWILTLLLAANLFHLSFLICEKGIIIILT